ncbi:hypothetical protein KZZ52_23815 [Dactylosporangium sp. AC04546]|uniref:hypothetical protein n=1 Tax=Dactylosporangium sp. AC04546 TaxID=2862460 RepID=UPI001EDF3E67|nr:hypothetical protein [Dactylosporangium sp. AC04546]WVK88305.1 hypothetical protein KZZ52_23815 [Dactylosporangium sp. AC04546]
MGLFSRRPLTPVERLMKAAKLPIAGGELPLDDIAPEVVRRPGKPAAAVLAVVEELLADAPQVAVSFLEDVQNIASHGADELLGVEDLLPLRGPRTVEAWETVDRFWAKVVAWCDENGVELEREDTLRAVSNPALLAQLRLTYRRLGDGRRVGLADVLRYEQATGEPMAVLGFHAQA